MKHKYRYFILLILIGFSFSSSLYAGDPYAANNGLWHIDLGPVNAVAKTTTDKNYLEIITVREGLLKAAGLQVGDLIVAANGVEFAPEKRTSTGNEPREAFGRELWKSAHTTARTLALKYLRKGVEHSVSITVPSYGDDKTQLLKVCDDIMATANGGGTFGTQVAGAIQGLVLLASGEEKYQEVIRKKAEYYFAFAKAENLDNSNWKMAYAGTFLGEYYLATGDSRALEALRLIGHLLAVRSNETGALSHGGLNYGGELQSKNPYGSRGMTIITTQAVLVWNYMEKAGILTDPIDIAARKKAIEVLTPTLSDTGSVAYHIGYKSNSSDSQGRAANYANVMQVGDFPNDTVTRGRLASTWLVARKHQLLFGHAATICSYWSSMSALHTLKPEGWEDAVSTYDWFRALSFNGEGSSTLLNYIPSRQNPGGDGYVGNYNVAQGAVGMQIALAAGTSKLFLHGGREKNWYKVDTVNAHLVEVITGKNGTATPSYKLRSSGESQTITITPKPGYKVASVKSKTGYLSFTGDRNSSVSVKLENITTTQKIYVTFVKSANVKLPPELNALALHLNASATPVSDTVAKWQDYSGFDRSGIMTNAAQEPNLQADQLNNYALMDFTGDKYYGLTGVKWSDLMTRVEGGVDSTWYVVTKVTKLGRSPYKNLDNHTTQIIGDNGDNGRNFMLGIDQNGFRAGRNNTARIGQGPQGKLFEDQPALLEVIFDGPKMTLNTYYAAGLYSSETKTLGDFENDDILNRQPNIANEGLWSWNNFYEGKIGEIMIYKDALATADRQNVRDYLMSKWLPEASNPKLAVVSSSSSHNMLESPKKFRRNYSLVLPAGSTALDLKGMSTLYGATIIPEDQRVVALDLTKDSQVIPVRVVSANGDVQSTYYITVYFRANLEWKFDEASGAVTQTSTTPTVVAKVNGPTWVAGVSGTALQFNDNNQVVDLGLNDMLPPWSITFRVNRQDSVSDTANFLKSANGAIRLEQTGNRKIGFTKSGESDFSFNYTIPANRWTTMAVVCEETGTKLYANGEFVEETSKFINLPLQELGNFKGTLDDLFIYRKAISVNQIKGTTNTSATGQGALTEEVWQNVTGGSTSNLVADPRYPNSPDVTRKMTNGFEALSSAGDNFGRRIRGYIKPSKTGEYTFWISSDDNSRLYLSDGTLAANATQIAYINGWTANFDSKSTQKSAPILLQAGRKYYVEVLHKEGGGGDHCKVAWQLANGEREVVPAENLYEYTPVAGDGSGLITEELWQNVAGSSVSDLTAHSAYPLNPDKVSQLTRFEALPNAGSNYGRRISGYIHPPASGKYTFWIASDDSSELWLSTDDDATHKVNIASLSGNSNVREWDKDSSQKSVEVDLVAGTRYYIEALHKEGSDGDHLAVAWQIPGGTREVIKGCYLSPAPYNQPEITLTLQPGWNTISLPFEVAKADALNAMGTLWVWKDGRYQQTTIPAAMQGFWLFNNETTVKTVTYRASAMRGTSRYRLKKGWNLAGPTENCPIPVQISTIYKWQNKAYEAVNVNSSLSTGRAYWFYNPENAERLISLPE